MIRRAIKSKNRYTLTWQYWRQFYNTW